MVAFPGSDNALDFSRHPFRTAAAIRCARRPQHELIVFESGDAELCAAYVDGQSMHDLSIMHIRHLKPAGAGCSPP